jgi:hypothetical protein
MSALLQIIILLSVMGVSAVAGFVIAQSRAQARDDQRLLLLTSEVARLRRRASSAEDRLESERAAASRARRLSRRQAAR